MSVWAMGAVNWRFSFPLSLYATWKYDAQVRSSFWEMV
jgi:membrane-bound acyltransferase YfiQ involved in biofilm formation